MCATTMKWLGGEYLHRVLFSCKDYIASEILEAFFTHAPEIESAKLTRINPSICFSDISIFMVPL